MLTEYALEKIAVGDTPPMNFHSLTMGVPKSTVRMQAEMNAADQYDVENRKLIHNITLPAAGAAIGAGIGAIASKGIARKLNGGDLGNIPNLAIRSAGAAVGALPGAALGGLAAKVLNRMYTKAKYREGDTTRLPIPKP
jgi:hypothetical protein